MAKFVINLKDVMDVSTRDYISNNVEMFKSTTPGPKGDNGAKGDAFIYSDFTPAQLLAL